MKPFKRSGDFVYVGRYQIGSEMIQVLGQAREYGGFFDSSPTSDYHPDEIIGVPRIVVGFAAASWRFVLDVLMHEASEFALVQLSCRYDRTDSRGSSSARYHFFFSHEQFAEANTRTAFFIAKAQLDVCNAWRQFKREEKQSKAKAKKTHGK